MDCLDRIIFIFKIQMDGTSDLLKEFKQNDSASYNKFGNNLLFVEQEETKYLNVYLPGGQCYLKELRALEKHWAEFLFRNDLPMIEIVVVRAIAGSVTKWGGIQAES